MPLVFDHLHLALRKRPILRDVSGRFERGRVTVILGANGAGKSSLLSCLCGLRTPDSGAITLADRPLGSLSDQARAQQMGLLPQQAEMHWDVDVKTIVGLGRLPYASRWGLSGADRDAIAGAMAATDCTALADRKVTRLSGGEQSRVLLARVLAGEPDWLLADEPLASLDPAHQFDILERLKGYARAGNGVITVLHDLIQAARVADDIMIMKQGEILAAGPCETVLTADNIAEAYGVAVDITRNAEGQMLVIPVRRL